MSKIGAILSVIEGEHCMGVDGLRDYHIASTVRDAGRIRDPHKRFRTIQLALTNYAVTVTWMVDNNEVRVRNNANTKEVYL